MAIDPFRDDAAAALDALASLSALAMRTHDLEHVLDHVCRVVEEIVGGDAAVIVDDGDANAARGAALSVPIVGARGESWGALVVLREDAPLRARDESFVRAAAVVVAHAIDRERAEAARSALVVDNAHALRMPLTALVLKVQGVEHLLRRQAPPFAGVAADRLASALRQTRRIADLVDALVERSREDGAVDDRANAVVIELARFGDAKGAP